MSLISFRRKIVIFLHRHFSRERELRRLARGVSAGFFAAAWPLPGLQFPLAILCAWIARGNKLAAIFPQMLSNAGTMLPLAFLEYRLGAMLWPSRARAAEEAIGQLRQAADAWSWSAPLRATKELLGAMGGLGHDVLGPLFIGVIISGAFLAAVSYPATLLLASFWRAKREERRLRRLRNQLGPPPAMPEEPGKYPSCPEAIAYYAPKPAQFVSATAARLLVDGREAYPDMLAAIAAARYTIDLEVYILRADRTGARFKEALIAAAGRGVHARLLYDYIGGRLLPPAFARELIRAGVEVAVYHPLVLSRPSWIINRRDHRKILVIDGETAFTGGLNICDEHIPVEEGGAGWRDTHVRFDGREVAARLTRLFEYGWRNATPHAETGSAAQQLRAGFRRLRKIVRRRLREVEAAPAAPPCAGDAPVWIIGNREFHMRRVIRRAYLRAINRAQRYILIENAYFIPDRGLRRALARAASRGVTVAVAVARNSDVALVAHASRHLYGQLLASGIALYEWPRGMLHAKTAVIDDVWSAVGTYNFDHRSLAHQLEVVAVVMDPAFARRLRDQTLSDLAKCHRISLREHQLRPWHQRIMGTLAYFLRYSL